MTTASARTLASSLDKLKISHGPQIPLKQKGSAVADSWEDDAGSDTETEAQIGSPAAEDGPDPPPPTPASPSYVAKGRTHDSPYQTLPPYGMTSYDGQDSTQDYVPRRGASDAERRPEKTTSTASRLIAAGIGQKAPRRTKEEREYDQAVKVQEKKKRDAAKEEEERKKRELEQARKAIWED